MNLSGLFTKYKNIVINAAVILVALFIASNFIYKKQQAEMSVLQEKKQDEEKKNKILNDISPIVIQIEGYKALLAKKDPRVVISSITEMAKAVGVKITSIRPGQEEKSGDYVKSSFDLTVQVESYHALGNFISMIESYNDVYLVDSVDIRANSQSSGLTVNLSISTISNSEL